MSTNLNFAPGEENITEVTVSPSVLLFWVKTHLGVSSTRVVTKVSNTVLGIIPLGASDASYPLSNVSSAGVNNKVHILRGFIGFLVAMGGLSSFGSSAPLALLLLLVGASMLVNSVDATLTLTNNAGGESEIRVSVLEKAKLEAFREEVNQRLFADHERLRHQEQMHIQNQQLQTQQAQLNAQIMQQQAGLTQQPPAAPQA